VRSLITFTISKCSLRHMVLCLLPLRNIIGYIQGVHKPEMFKCMSSLGHLQGEELWIQEGHQGQESCSPQIDKAVRRRDTKDNPASLSVGYVPAWMTPTFFQHWREEADDGLRAPGSVLSSPAVTLCKTAVSAERV